MISNTDIKLYASLKHKKFRLEHQLFLVEGRKTIDELLKSSLKVKAILGLEARLKQSACIVLDGSEVVNAKTLQRISNMKSASDIIAVVHIPKKSKAKSVGNSILIDDIQDPGNLGTIIRTAHWFGFNQVVCSENSVDLYNHKVIQSSMGAVFKLKVSYTNLEEFIPEIQTKGLRVLGTFMEGESIYKFNFTDQDVFVLGNEGQGISKNIERIIDKKISIPNFSKGDATESLNISIAGAVVCSEMAR